MTPRKANPPSVPAAHPEPPPPFNWWRIQEAERLEAVAERTFETLHWLIPALRQGKTLLRTLGGMGACALALLFSPSVLGLPLPAEFGSLLLFLWFACLTVALLIWPFYGLGFASAGHLERRLQQVTLQGELLRSEHEALHGTRRGTRSLLPPGRSTADAD